MTRPRWNAPQFDETWALQRRAGLIDMHVDAIIQQRLFGYDLRRRHRPGLRGQPLFNHADIPRMRDAGYRGACLGIHYWPRETEGAWRELNHQLDYLDIIAAEDPYAMRIHTHSDWADAQQRGLLGLAPGVEGAHMLNGRLERVAQLAERGVAYLTLTHFSRNAAATPSLGRGANHRDGLTPFGHDLVRALNDHGIVVDVAHVNPPGVLDACNTTSRPLLCTHTGVQGVYHSPRNITDDAIDAIAATDGVIGIIFGPIFLAGTLCATTDAILDHIDYVVQRVGVRHVALGSDYDGWMPSIPSDHRDCRDTIRITHGLRQRGYTDDDITLILSDNVQRVFDAQTSASSV